MRKVTNKYSGKMIALYLSGLIPVVWLALKSAPYFIKNGLVGILENAGDIFNNPFHITLVQGSLQVVLISLPRGTTGDVRSTALQNGEMQMLLIGNTELSLMKTIRF